MKTLMILLLLISVSVNAQVYEKWVARYTTNTGVIGADYDEAFSVIIDDEGYVYVTGSTFETVNNGLDITTIKYSPGGEELWRQSYVSAPHDRGNVLRVDNSGNVYVAGYTGFNFILLKYNSAGELQWNKNLSGGNSQGYPRTMEIDNNGDIIITGWKDVQGESYNIFTVKFNAEGEEIWQSVYNGSGNYDDYPNALALDSEGNVYIAGEVRESGGSQKDYITIKYGSDGTQLWAKEYGTPYVDDMATGIDTDADGNVFVTGQGMNAQGDFVTIKYDPSGEQVWLKNYNGPATYDGLAYLKTDAAGNVYISGRSTGGQNAPDYTTIKYNTNGDKIWENRYNGTALDTDEIYSMAMDDEANIYLTGSSRGPGGAGRDYATVKIDSSGTEKWSIRYDAGFTHDEAYSIDVNAAGEVAVCGYSVGNGTGRDYAVVVYTESPTSVKELEGITPSGFSLAQNYPNPFNPSTTISFSITEKSNVILKIFNALGEDIETLYSGDLDAGVYNYDWNAAELTSGIYFYSLTAGNYKETKKLILMK